MKYTRRLCALIALSLACTSPLFACAFSTERPLEETESDQTDLRAHYDALVQVLQEELSTIRTDTYMTTEALRSRVEALEAALAGMGVEIPADTGAAESSTQTDTSRGDTDTTLSPSETLSTLSPETEHPTTPDGFAYILTDGQVTITGYTPTDGYQTSVVLPSSIQGYPVTAIGDNAIEGLPIRSVTLPATLTHIGWFAFAGCESLTTITIPASVERIDYGAFDGCSRLTIYCPRDSYAARYAAAAGMAFVGV